MALAKYVIALVKKDKPQEELKSVMQGQMEVFLQNETKNFIELLFQVLEDKAYLQQEAPVKPAAKQVSKSFLQYYSTLAEIRLRVQKCCGSNPIDGITVWH